MTSVQCFRLCRPSIRAVRVPGLSHAFHGGLQSGTSRLQDEASRSPAPSAVGRSVRAALGASEFKKLRINELEEVGAKELYKESHPRLVHRQNPMSVPAFRKVKSGVKLDDPSNTEIVTLYGRIGSIRVHGKNLVFLTIVNEFEAVQGMINFRKLRTSPELTIDGFKLFTRLIEKGDHISLTGKATRTSTGELTVEAVMLPELLSPAMEQIPETLTDPETRAQKRHVDMMVNPEVSETLRLRSHITKYMRDYFHRENFLEFQTPILAENAGGATARPFVTTATEFRDRSLALRIAPELWLKRLVIGGVHNVFEIGPAFRNEGIDATHNPEFTMCEFYSAYTNLPDLIRRTEDLLSGLAHHCQELISTQLTSLKDIDLSQFSRPYAQVEFIPALEEALGFRLPKLTGDGAYPEMLAVLKLGNINIPGDMPQTMQKLLDRLATVYLEPKSFNGPLFITHHPACMSPLAKSFLCPKTFQLVSARTELFIHGRELANMYEEENDPAEQARKLSDHQTLGTNPTPGPLDEIKRKSAPLDMSYVKALDAGLPPTGGWGCGVERLVMLFSGANRISDCLSFGTLRNVVGLSAEARAAEGVVEE